MFTALESADLVSVPLVRVLDGIRWLDGALHDAEHNVGDHELVGFLDLDEEDWLSL